MGKGESLKERVARLVAEEPGLADRELTDRLFGPGSPQQPVNQAARALVEEGRIHRLRRADGKLGNYPGPAPGARRDSAREAAPQPDATAELSEDEVKRLLGIWLERDGWSVSIAWGTARGVDIDARRNGERWLIEVKGCGSRDPMRVNYFLAALGELLQRMTDPRARYSVAFPDLPQFSRLWQKLPRLAKDRTGITALFVAASGDVREAR